MEDGNVQVVDVRPPFDFAGSHIPNSLSLPGQAFAPGAARLCSTSASVGRTWSISHGRSSPAVSAASLAITWPSRSFRIGPTQATGLPPLRIIPVSSGNARNRAGARATLLTLTSSTGASGPRAPVSSGEGICGRKI